MDDNVWRLLQKIRRVLNGAVGHPPPLSEAAEQWPGRAFRL